MTIHQDVDLYATVLGVGEIVAFDVKPSRTAWVQMARGTATLNGEQLRPGDGVAVTAAARLELTGTDDAEVLLFDLPA